MGALACYKGKEEIAVSKYYDIFSVNEKSIPEYLEPFLLQNGQILRRMSEGTLEEKKRVHYLNFINFKIFPILPEQTKIADFLMIDKNIDDNVNQ